MAQQIKRLAAKPNTLSLILKPHMVEGKTDSCKLSSNLHTCSSNHIHIINKCKIKVSYGVYHLELSCRLHAGFLYICYFQLDAQRHWVCGRNFLLYIRVSWIMPNKCSQACIPFHFLSNIVGLFFISCDQDMMACTIKFNQGNLSPKEWSAW